MFLTALAVFPGALLIYYVYKLDKIEGEPKTTLTRLLIFGALTVIPAAIIETILLSLFKGDSIFYYLIENFLFIALVEEGTKYIMLSTMWKKTEFNYQYDGVVYAVVISMGFAIVENIMYVFTMGGLQVALLRAITSIPGHALFAIYMGNYYGKAKMAEKMGQFTKKKNLLTYSLFVPVLLHGMYDFLATVNGLLFIPFVIVIEVCAFLNLKKYSKSDMPFPNVL